MKIIEKNVFCGEIEPQPIVETPYSKITNEGIWSKEVFNEDGSKSVLWYVSQSTKELFEDKIKEIVDEHDLLLADIIESGV